MVTACKEYVIFGWQMAYAENHSSAAGLKEYLENRTNNKQRHHLKRPCSN